MIVNRKQAEQAILTLGLGDTVDVVTADAVNQAYRTLARSCHPDGGGSMEAFVTVDRAKHVLLNWIQRREAATPKAVGGLTICHRCDGKGFIMQQRGFRSMRVQCPRCKGTGDLDYEHEKGDFR